MTKRKFYKTVITVTVLSEEELNSGMSLSDLDHLITHGDCSGEVEWKATTKINGKAMAKALIAQGSDPEFFQITEDGEDLYPDGDE